MDESLKALHAMADMYARLCVRLKDDPKALRQFEDSWMHRHPEDFLQMLTTKGAQDRTQYAKILEWGLRELMAHIPVASAGVVLLADYLQGKEYSRADAGHLLSVWAKFDGADICTLLLDFCDPDIQPDSRDVYRVMSAVSGTMEQNHWADRRQFLYDWLCQTGSWGMVIQNFCAAPEGE